jgi:2'-5' RNA ligase
VHVPEAEPIVGELRLRHTSDAPLGLPPHVTLLVPFVPAEQLGNRVETRLAEILGAAEPFAVTFARTAHFPRVLYVEPQPSEPFVELTGAIVAEWPEHPPYEGTVEAVIPHLTVAESEDQALFDRIEAEVQSGLPFHTHVSEARLYAEDTAGRWHEYRSFPLAG